MKFIFPIDDARCTWSGPGKYMSWGEYANISRLGERQYHLALDLKGSNKTVRAFCDGVVRSCADNRGESTANGNYVVIEHVIDGKTVYSFYAHLENGSVKVKNGDKVMVGDPIGRVGDSGSAAPKEHLHFSVVNKLTAGTYDGYGYKNEFPTVHTCKHNNIVYYNPYYIITEKKLP